MTLHTCPLCGSTTSSIRHSKPLPIRNCACGLAFLWPRPTQEELREIYSENYYKSWGLEGENDLLPRQMKHLTFQARLNRVSSFLKPGKVLDVGCATGYFLEVAKESGWDIAGVELSEYSAKLAADRFGGGIFHGSLEQAAFADETFDLVALSDLIEHISSPVEFLSEVRRILKNDGMVMVVTPNISSMTERLMQGKWSHYKTEHLYYFSPATISECLAKAGFSIVLSEPAPKFLNIEYINNQFAIYHHAILTPLIKLLNFIVPKSLRRFSFALQCGEMLVLARKIHTTPGKI